MKNNTDLPIVKAPNPVVPAEYNKLVASARLRDIRLTKSDFSLEAEAVSLKQDWKLSHSCEIQKIHLDGDSHLLLVWVDAEAHCKKKNKRIVSAKCQYLVVYDIDGTPEEVAINAFALRVARFAAYPYFRAHFAELTAQGGVMLPPLPVIKETRLLPKDNALAIEAKGAGEKLE